MDNLAQAIQIIVLWQCTDKLYKLVLIYQLRACSREQSITRRQPVDGEGKTWIIAPHKTQVIVQARASCISIGRRLMNQIIWQDVMRSVGRVNYSWNDPHGQPIRGLVLDGKIQSLYIIPIDIAYGTSERQGRAETEIVPDDIRGLVSWAHRLCIDCFRILDVGDHGRPDISR